MMTVYNLPPCMDYPDEDTFIHASPRWMRIAIHLLGESTEIFNDPLAERIVKEIDKTEHIKDGVFNSPWLGIIPWEKLSSGAKGLILIMMSSNPELKDIPWLFNSAIWGDNCIPLLAEMSFKYDFKMLLGNGMGWMLDGNESRRICAQTDKGVPINTCYEMQLFRVGCLK